MTKVTPSKPMMKCGHTANAKRAVDQERNEWIPACAICDCTEQTEMPNLENRQAICCGKDSIRPSSDHEKLAFFEFRGEGSKDAVSICKNCRYALIAHDRKKLAENQGKHHLKDVCDNFQPQGPQKYDRYYCGCRGWD